MQLSSISATDIEKAFKDFNQLMMTSECFRELFDSQVHIDDFMQRQADSFYQSLSMSDEDFKTNYLELGLTSAKLTLPFEIMVITLNMVRDNLLKNTPVQASVIYTIVEKMERYLAKGYLEHQFEDVLSQLDFSIESIEETYVQADKEVVIRPVNWLKQLVMGFKESKRLEPSEILTADLCPLTPMINALAIESDLKQRILISHTEQHSLALSMAFLFREEDYMLMSFIFSRLFAITVSLSNQVGLAVSHQAIEELQYDALTGLLLRHSLDKKFQETVKKSVFENQSIAIIMLDLDHFKMINDTWGHPAGDKVLKALGELVQSNQRQDDLAFRYGGEEFLLLVSNTSLEKAQLIAERIRHQVEKLKVAWEGTLMPLTLSVGALVINAGNLQQPIESYIEKADQNLYQAKDLGRNKVVTSTFEPA